MVMESTTHEIRLASNAQQARDWSLVLSSQSISHQIHETAHGFVILVDDENAARAANALDGYDRESASRDAPMEPTVEYGPTSAALVVSVLLFLAYAATSRSARWYDVGGAAAALIRQGEVWRTITALTLHASVAHVAANAVACAIFGSALMRIVGPGVGIVLLLLSGAGGNLINALVRSSHHVAVGASTSIFGAVGALAGMQLTHRRRASPSQWRAWAPLAAGIALLAWLGTSAESDVLAHGFGFLVGAGLGVALPRVLPDPPETRAQYVLVLSAALIVALSWTLAILG
jgi:membrane associated rhomboid family serine protease